MRTRLAWLLAGLGLSLVAADWPRFRGPNGTGVAADKDVPVQWDAKENVLWKKSVPGVGHSSPIVSGNKLFLQSSSEDGAERWLLCYEVANGDLLWKKSAPGAKVKTHPKNNLASSTPCTDGERVYAASWDGKDVSLVAYDFKGEQAWKRDLGGFVSQHGAGFSPMVYGGKVFLNDDQDGAAELLAFDAKTGRDAWKAERKAFRACYSTPFVLEKDKGEAELIVASTGAITSYQPDDGSVNWTYAWGFAKMPLRTVASPLAAAGLIVANSGDGAGDRDAIAIRPGVGELTEKNLVWQVRKTFPYVPCLLAKGDYLYGVNDEGAALCIAAKTGEVVWSERLNSPMTASPLLIDGAVYAFGEDGKVHVFAAEPKYKSLGRNDLGEGVMATPAVADGRLYVRGNEHLYCIGKSGRSSGN
jgi:outer membrane protein assembly factor BamB